MPRRRAPLTAPGALGTAAQQARLASGLTQAELAARLDVPQSTISELENGKATIFVRRYFEVMRETGMTLIAEWDDESESDRGDAPRR